MFKGLWFFLKNSWQYDKCYVLWGIGRQLLNSLIPIVATLIPKYLIDELMGSARPGQLVLYTAILTGYELLAGCFAAFFQWDGFTRRCEVEAKFEKALHRRLAEADFQNLEDASFLDLQAKAKKFLSCDWHGFGYLLDRALEGAGQILTMLAAGVLLWHLSPWALATLTLLTAAGTLVEGRAKKKAAALSLQLTNDQRGRMYFGDLFDDFSYGKEIRLNAMGDFLLEKENTFVQRAMRLLYRHNRYYMQSGLFAAFAAFGQQSVCYIYLLAQVVQQKLTIGDFTLYSGAMTAYARALKGTMDVWAELNTFDAYFDALDHYLKVPAAMHTTGRDLPKAQTHTITFQHVSFRYPGQESWALRDVCITLRAGDSLAIVGENGAGKTTFVKLLCRLYDPTEGCILLDGQDIRRLHCESYRQLFSAVFQDFKLFAMTLSENVCLALPKDDTRAEALLRKVGLGDRLDSLPLGVHTPVYRNLHPEGFQPSGGEAQKIALARALYRDAPFVLLDEPTAALDPKAEAELYAQFHRLTDGKTAVYITHRMAAARFCRRIAVFENGRLTDVGSHDELIARDGLYARLFKLQARYYA